MPKSYEIIADERGNDLVRFDPSIFNCVGLRMNARYLEEDLQKGKWLVLAYAAWSASDVNCIETGVAAIKRLPFEIKYGVRAFNDVGEFATWAPEACPRGGQTLVWLLYDRGVMKGIRFGALDEREIVNWTSENLRCL